MEELDERFVALWHIANEAGLGVEVCYTAIQLMKEDRLHSVLLAMQLALEDWDIQYDI